jgi:hypothetical protein
MRFDSGKPFLVTAQSGVTKVGRRDRRSQELQGRKPCDNNDVTDGRRLSTRERREMRYTAGAV